MLALPVWLLALTVLPSAGSRNVGEWEVEVQGSRVFVSQAAVPAWPGGPIKLVLRCNTWEEKGKLIGKHQRERDVYLFYAPGFGSAEGSLLVSLAGEPQPKKYWGAPSEDGKSFFVRGTGLTGGVDGFIRSLRAHSKMTVVVTPKKKEAFPEISFDLGELDEALKPLLELCPMKEK